MQAETECDKDVHRRCPDEEQSFATNTCFLVLFKPKFRFFNTWNSHSILQLVLTLTMSIVATSLPFTEQRHLFGVRLYLMNVAPFTPGIPLEVHRTACMVPSPRRQTIWSSVVSESTADSEEWALPSMHWSSWMAFQWKSRVKLTFYKLWVLFISSDYW